MRGLKMPLWLCEHILASLECFRSTYKASIAYLTGKPQLSTFIVIFLG